MQNSFSPTKRLTILFGAFIIGGFALSGITSTYYSLTTPKNLNNNSAQVLSETTERKVTENSESTQTPSSTNTSTPESTTTSTPSPTATIVASPTSTLTQTPIKTAAPTVVATKAPAAYTCNCSKSCTQISSCQEAYYQLNTCGCKKRDGNGDGIPCENLCR